MYKKILKFPVPVDLARWDIADGNYNILEKYKLAGKHILLTVARLKERYKGHDKVIKSLALILAKIPDVYYIIVGSGPLRPYLEALAMACGVHDKVLFLGSISDADLKVLYNACDVFIMASRNRLIDGGAEGFGLAFLEANYFEKPVIGGNSGGIPDAVIDGVTGILINPEDEKEIAEAVVKLLLDKELAKRLGSNGRERVRGEFTWEKVINRMSGALREVVKNSN